MAIATRGVPGNLLLRRSERIENPHSELTEITFIASYDGESMYPSGSADHCVFQQVIGFLVDQSSPFAKARGIHRQYLVRIGNLTEPAF